jgi:26S proteasome regulatory subunit N7
MSLLIFECINGFKKLLKRLDDFFIHRHFSSVYFYFQIMPVEDLSDEGLPKVPNLELAQLKFLLTLQPNDKTLKEKLLNEIQANNMTPFYLECIKDGQLPSDDKLVEKMRLINEEKLKELDGKIEENEQAFGDSEIRENYLSKTQYLCLIGDREQALTWLRKTYEKTVTLGHRLDLIFYQLRLGLFYLDQDLVQRNLDKAKTLVDEGGDWDRRNRMKVYQGLRAMSIRDFKSAAELFLDTVATFTSYELMDYQTFVTYTVICCLEALERPKLREKGRRLV